jgi:hypothetical protein
VTIITIGLHKLYLCKTGTVWGLVPVLGRGYKERVRAGGVVQVESLSSSPSTTKKTKKRT